MFDVKGKAADGHRALARRALRSHEQLGRYVTIPRAEEGMHQEYRKRLERVEAAGEVEHIGKEGAESMVRFMDVLEGNMPELGMRGVYDLAGASICKYFGIENAEELAKRGRIGSIIVAHGDAAVQTAVYADGRIANTLRIAFLSNRRAYSIVNTAHEMVHLLQDGTYKLIGIAIDAEKIDGMEEFGTSIFSDPELRQTLVEVTSGGSHQLRFWNRLEVLAVADRMGVDMKRFRVYLNDNIPTADYLTAMNEGEAHVIEVDCVALNPEINCNPLMLHTIQSVGFIDAFVSPFQKGKSVARRVGIGMAQYFEDHPSEASALRTDRSFHKEVSEAIFGPLETSA